MLKKFSCRAKTTLPKFQDKNFKKSLSVFLANVSILLVIQV